MKGHNVLIVEDDETTLEALEYALIKEGYHVCKTSDGLAAVEVARREKPSLIVIDVMLPKLNGLEVCRALRQETNVPIMIVTAKVDIDDRVRGLEAGADDYIVKPYSIREFLTRVRVHLRRMEIEKTRTRQLPQDSPSVIRTGNLEIDLTRYQVLLGDRCPRLRPKEFKLLALLAKNAGKVFTREQILLEVWGPKYEGDAHTVDVHIRSIRRKIEPDPTKPEHIVTVWGVGYKFEL